MMEIPSMAVSWLMLLAIGGVVILAVIVVAGVAALSTIRRKDGR